MTFWDFLDRNWIIVAMLTPACCIVAICVADALLDLVRRR